MASVIDRLHAQRERIKGLKRTTMAVPGWSGLVHVRYKPIPFEEAIALIESSDGSPRDALRANIEALYQGCDAILVRDDDGEPVSLADTLREQGEDVIGEVCFDSTLVEVLGLTIDEKPAEGVSQTILALFAGVPTPELAIAEHAIRLGRWTRGADEEVEAAIVGG